MYDTQNQKRKFLWYNTPANKWLETLPLGNGRIGAMVYGKVEEEKIQVDENTFWSGKSSETNNRLDSKEIRKELIQLLLDKKFDEADHLGHIFVGNKNDYGTNMPVGNLIISLREWKQENIVYKYRLLNMEEAVARTLFEYEGCSFCRESFVSEPDQVLCIRFSQDGKRKFDIDIIYQGIGNNVAITGWNGKVYKITGDAYESLHSDGKCGVHLCGAIVVLTDGKQDYKDGKIIIRGATEITLYLDIQTDMFRTDPFYVSCQNVIRAVEKGYEVVKKAHIADVKKLYCRMDFELGESEYDNIPTDKRIQKMSLGEEDQGLIAQMFEYGRYLLIASSRESSLLPTHMGGIWNDNIYNNIDCTQDMHIDMNLQMQYWLAAQCNLKESYLPFIRYIQNILVPSGRKTAYEVYGARGWMAHIVTNPWGYTSLGWSYNWGVWALGGAWCASLLWDYYEYTMDVEFLRTIAYPIIKGAAEFALDYVFYDSDSGYYMTGPSYSPENMFCYEGKEYFLSLSCTCDVIMIREILTITRKMSAILKEESGSESSMEIQQLDRSCQEVLEKLPPYQIGSNGQIQEWFYDFEEPQLGHRHTSHLLGLYPFWQIDACRMPELAKAAERSIERRYQDFEVTSWGMAMLIGYFARMGNGEKSYKILQDTFRQIVRPNMASVMGAEDTMWKSTWELDGNTGLTAAITEMVIQSNEHEIRILPAIPATWKRGHIRGACVKGGHEIDILWKEDGEISIILHPHKDEIKTIIYGKQKIEIRLFAEKEVSIKLNKKFEGGYTDD